MARNGTMKLLQFHPQFSSLFKKSLNYTLLQQIIFHLCLFEHNIKTQPWKEKTF
jgi:hypothetical protein